MAVFVNMIPPLVKSQVGIAIGERNDRDACRSSDLFTGK